MAAAAAGGARQDLLWETEAAAEAAGPEIAPGRLRRARSPDYSWQARLVVGRRDSMNYLVSAALPAPEPLWLSGGEGASGGLRCRTRGSWEPRARPASPCAGRARRTGASGLPESSCSGKSPAVAPLPCPAACWVTLAPGPEPQFLRLRGAAEARRQDELPGRAVVVLPAVSWRVLRVAPGVGEAEREVDGAAAQPRAR